MQIPAPSLPTEAYTMLVPIFEKRGIFFNGRGEFAKLRKRGHFSGVSPRNFEKGLSFACLKCYAICINVFEL